MSILVLYDTCLPHNKGCFKWWESISWSIQICLFFLVACNQSYACFINFHFLALILLVTNKHMNNQWRLIGIISHLPDFITSQYCTLSLSFHLPEPGSHQYHWPKLFQDNEAKSWIWFQRDNVQTLSLSNRLYLASQSQTAWGNDVAGCDGKWQKRTITEGGGGGLWTPAPLNLQQRNQRQSNQPLFLERQGENNSTLYWWKGPIIWIIRLEV